MNNADLIVATLKAAAQLAIDATDGAYARQRRKVENLDSYHRDRE